MVPGSLPLQPETPGQADAQAETQQQIRVLNVDLHAGILLSVPRLVPSEVRLWSTAERACREQSEKGKDEAKWYTQVPLVADRNKRVGIHACSSLEHARECFRLSSLA